MNDDKMTHILTYGEKTCKVRIAGGPLIKDGIKYYSVIPGQRTFLSRQGVHMVPNVPESALKPIEKRTQFFYWRRGRAHNANMLHVVFVNREHGEGISAWVKEGSGEEIWRWYANIYGHMSNGIERTQERAQAKVNTLILFEFREEYKPYFG